MSLHNRVEDLARTAACISTSDLAGLVRLQDDLTDLAESIEDPSIEAAASVCRVAAEQAESIVLRTTEDADATLGEIHKAIEYVQEIAEAIQAGLDPSSVAIPNGHEAATPSPEDAQFDLELLSAWVSSCSSALSDLEAAVVSIDAGDEDTGQLAEARRIIHTIKGEAGILSFNSVQAVCHDCETLIDLAKERTDSFPTEQALALIDWLRACIAALSDNPSATLPPHDELHAEIKNAIANLDSEAVATESASSPETETGPTPSSETPAEAPAAKQAEPQPTPAQEMSKPPAAAEPAQPEAEDDSLVEFPDEAIIDETVPEFVCEAREHIANAEQSLLDLESDLGNTELINTVFRAFHTIKGVAGFMHLSPIVRLTHVAETLLDKARSQALTLTPGHLDLFLRSCDVLGQLISALLGTPTPKQSVYKALVAELDQACETGLPPVVETPPEQPAAVVETPPAAQSSQPQQAADSPAPSAQETQPQLPDDPQADSGGADASPPPSQAETAEPNPAPPEAKPATKPAMRIEQTVKVNTTRMDALVDMVGELVIGYQMVYQDESIQGIKAQHTKRTLTHVSKIIRDLQEVAMSLRLVTLRPTFQKMARLVRDVSSKANKNIKLHVEGEDVELDRTVVEEIADPLVHMIRNACDHGIEPEDERRAAGKSPEGNLSLRAYHQGGSIVVEIADDGRGLIRENILAKAASNGILPSDREPAEMSDREVFNLIFAPGFSTADKVTDISGRGVGMDVVRRNIEALRGKVDISSTPGKGSTFKMLLPLTMAIIDGMIVRVGSHRYVVPTLSIEQSFRPEPGKIHTVIGKGETVEVRGSLLPVYRAKRVFGLDDGVDNPTEGLLVVLESHSTRFCLLVDEIVGQQQVVIKNLGHGINPIRGVSGGAILGDGRVALILDVTGIVQEATKEIV
ncbi:MAG: Hpt domain-containing protein [Planctomycetota bacterium]|nr:Hpt domain-containing protein [Planctomycetota bacterium]